jgi:Delta3-Delta2-enoyl-CoA isomerase
MILTVDHGKVRELRLHRPPVNALNPELIAAIRGALAQAVADGCAGVVLAGAPGYFSAGLDVPELLKLDRAGMRAAWAALFGLLRDLACGELPTAVALTGHSPAGGTVLGIFADYRVQADGPFRLGLNEVQVGLPLPEIIFRGLRHVVGDRQAERLAVGGWLVAPAEALRYGLVDEVVPLADVVPRAIAWVSELVARPPGAMRATRHLARSALRAAFDGLTPTALDVLVDQWFSAETQGVMRALAEKLGKRA